MGILDWKHWIVILVVVVLIFGTRKLKHLGTDVGESIKGFRNAMNDGGKDAGNSADQQASPTVEAPPIIDGQPRKYQLSPDHPTR